MHNKINIWARKLSSFFGSSYAIVGAVLIIFVWFIGGFFIGFSDQNYSLLINTLTTIITFIMVFIIQNTTNNDTLALHLKIDELIKTNEEANHKLIGVEKLEDKNTADLEEVKKEAEKERLKVSEIQ